VEVLVTRVVVGEGVVLGGGSGDAGGGGVPYTVVVYSAVLP